MMSINASAEEAVIETLQRNGPALWTISSGNFRF